LFQRHAIHVTGADIQPTAIIGPGLLIHHPVGIVIGCGAIVGGHCTILQNATIGEKYALNDIHKYPTLGNNVTVCAGACIIGPCQIGDNSIVGANAVVFSDVPPDSTAVGIPAVIKSRGTKLGQV
jgi:serine O-acetyltransferase